MSSLYSRLKSSKRKMFHHDRMKWDQILCNEETAINFANEASEKKRIINLGQWPNYAIFFADLTYRSVNFYIWLYIASYIKPLMWMSSLKWGLLEALISRSNKRFVRDKFWTLDSSSRVAKKFEGVTILI